MRTPELHVNPDGRVYVRDSSDDFANWYDEPAEQFQKDWGGEKLPDLPRGANERLYRQGRSHAIMDGESVIEGGPMPWHLGDLIIKALPKLRAAKEARKPPEPEMPPIGELTPVDPRLDAQALRDEINSLKVRVIALEDQLKEREQ